MVNVHLTRITHQANLAFALDPIANTHKLIHPEQGSNHSLKQMVRVAQQATSDAVTFDTHTPMNRLTKPSIRPYIQ